MMTIKVQKSRSGLDLLENMFRVSVLLEPKLILFSERI